MSLMCLTLVASLAVHALPPAVRALNTQVPQGGVLILTAVGKAESLHARLGEHRHPFFTTPEGLAVLVPVPHDHLPGTHAVKIETDGMQVGSLSLTVTPSKWPTLKVQVASRIAEPSAADKARAAREREEFRAILATPGATRMWSAPFQNPGGGKVTCGFGATRHFNGVVQSVHRGIDLRAAVGTPVFASAPGTVRLSKDVFYGGNLVFLDHGCGLFSTYAHLSRLDVKPGQTVQARERLGLSGATGRVSAPHLHWGTSIAGVEVDPLLLQKATAALCGAPAPRAVRRKGRR